MRVIIRKGLLLLCGIFLSLGMFAQDIPVHVSNTRVYSLIDELANDGIIQLHSVIKPYSRAFVAQKLVEASHHLSDLNNRQKSELAFMLRDFALELEHLPQTALVVKRTDHLVASAWPPQLSYRDSLCKIRIAPIIGMTVMSNESGTITKRWYGADFQSYISTHLSVYASLRDISIAGALLAKPGYLNDYPGYEYKESSVGGDYSDMRGGIKWANSWASLGLVKDHVIWGDNYHGSNILSGRTPSFPMLTLSLKPARWIELQYLHGWLVSNVIDSSRYYLDNVGNKKYRMANKFIAANMITFTPVSKLGVSVGNSIVYAEDQIQPAYLIPLAFYKSIDHTLTKGLSLENQNSQLFLNLSSRNIRHLHLYSSVFADEISLDRFKPSVAQKNPISYKIGANLTNFPLQNLSVTGEYTRTSIIVYKHSIPALTWASNGYNLGSYLGDNSKEWYLALAYKPIRGLDVNVSMVDAKHGNEYNYIRRDASGKDQTKIFLAQPSLGEISWSNRTYSLEVQYELVNNMYAYFQFDHSNIRGFDLSGTPISGDMSEVLLDAQGYLNRFTPTYLQGTHNTVTIGFNIGF